MKAVFWGVRGSTPSPGSSTLRYGGNTSCVEVRLPGGGLVILDSGTGIRLLGKKLLQEPGPVKATVIFSHFHWDHIQGFPFFRPAFVKGNEFSLVGSPKEHKSIREVLANQMNSVNFPVNFDYMSATFKFHEVKEMKTEIGAAKVSFLYANHTSECLASRFEAKGRTLIYMTDNELEKSTPTPFKKFVKFCEGADVLIHDAQYTPETYGPHQGWGHSSWESVIRLAREASVKNLYLYHHDPETSDTLLEEILQKSQGSAAGSGVSVFAAQEGLEIEA